MNQSQYTRKWREYNKTLWHHMDQQLARHGSYGYGYDFSSRILSWDSCEAGIELDYRLIRPDGQELPR